ncbi:MAG: DUF4097 family beta strand repeat-containing protein [Phycisphaerales bacterium]
MRFAILAFTLAGSFAFAGDRVEETRHHRLPAHANLPLSVQTNNGDIEIVRTDTSEIVITAVAHARNKDRLAQIKFSAVCEPGSGTDIHVDLPPPEKDQDDGCSFRVEMPMAVNVTATTSNGGITCYGMSGQGEFTTANGAIAIEAHDGPVRASTSNGPVTAKLANAPTKIRTSNGPVTFTLKDGASAPFDIQTSNAGVHITLPDSFSGIVDAATSNGTLSIPPSAKVSTPSSKPGASKQAGTFSLGNATDKSTVRTSNGPVEIAVGSTAAENAARPQH